MTADQHIEGIKSALHDVEQAQEAARIATKRARKATALLHARLVAAAVEFKDAYGHDSDVMTAAVAPKTKPQED